jgi:7-carboxy-7-deazaguanine synthase
MTLPESQKHRLQLLQDKPAGSLLIHEIYRSIQGESTFAGLPCVFVRLAVCNSRCNWCDTPHAFTQGHLMSPEEIIQAARDTRCPLVEITGGEPLLQAEVLPLMSRLADECFTVLLETSGALPVKEVDPRVLIIMDLKCPDSGECEGNLWENLDHLEPDDEIKFVLASEGDFRWAEQTIQKYQLERFQVLLSPVFGRVTPRQLAEWLLASRLQRVRLQIQLHKQIWDPNARGV